MPEAGSPVTVLAMAPVLGRDLAYLAVDPRVEVLDGTAAYEAAVHAEEPARPAPAAPVDQGELDRLLARAEVVVVGHPVPRVLAARAPRLRWAHHTQAGVSNLHRSDLWTADGVLLTSARGSVSARAIAEWAIAAVLFGFRGLDEAVRQQREGRFTRRGYRMRTAEGSTLGVVGLGGIGREVGRLGQALGMRVVATRFSIDVPEEGVDGADLVLPADRLLEVAAASDALVVCSQLTQATRGLIGAEVLAAMPEHALLVNVARGEEVDEDALVDALEAGRIGGAVLDVQAGELEGRPPRRELVEHPRVLLTPHLSGSGARANAELGRGLVAENLRRYLAGEPLVNLVDRARGY